MPLFFKFLILFSFTPPKTEYWHFSKFASKLILFKPKGIFFLLLSVLNKGEINTKLAFKLLTLLKSLFP